MHILFLNGWYPSRVLPFNGDFIQRHAEAVALRHNVTSIHVVTDPDLTKEEQTEENIRGVRTIITYIKPTRSCLIKFIRFFKAYKRILRGLGSYDIIHVHKLYPVGIIALALKMIFKKKYIISEHWTGYNNSSSLPLIEKSLSKIIANYANYICPVSADLGKSMIDLGLKGNYHVVPNVVDTSIFKPSKTTNNDVFSLVHISNMVDEHKNVTGILNAASKLKNISPNFKLYLIGNRSQKYNTYSKILGIEDHVVFVDQIEHSKVVRYIRNADVLILFSNYENLPCVILEAFSCGIPVISTKTGGISEYFPDSFGYLIPVKNENDLIKSIISIQNEKKKIASKDVMHSFVKDNFGREVICDTFSALYHSSLGNQL